MDLGPALSLSSKTLLQGCLFEHHLPGTLCHSRFPLSTVHLMMLLKHTDDGLPSESGVVGHAFASQY